MNPLKHTKKKQKVELAAFIEQLQEQLPQVNEKKASNLNFIEEYRQLVALTFGANILFKGVRYANRLHNHVVHVCYTNSLKLIIRERLAPEETKKLIEQLQATHNQLMQYTFAVEEAHGLANFYQAVGGNKKKHKINQKAIFTLYIRIKQRSEKNSLRICWELIGKVYQKILDKKAYVLWQLKSYTWK